MTPRYLKSMLKRLARKGELKALQETHRYETEIVTPANLPLTIVASILSVDDDLQEALTQYAYFMAQGVPESASVAYADLERALVDMHALAHLFFKQRGKDVHVEETLRSEELGSFFNEKVVKMQEKERRLV